MTDECAVTDECAFCRGRMIWWTFDEDIPMWRLCSECDLPEGAIIPAVSADQEGDQP